MPLFLLFLAALAVLQGPAAAAQHTPSDTLACVLYVEEMPELAGGLDTLQSLIQYPEQAQEARVEGRVFVEFVVTETGSVEEALVRRGVHPALDAEALRVVRLLKFRPGQQRGRPVRVRFSLPVTFRLEERP